MNGQTLRLVQPRPVPAPDRARRRLGRILVDRGAITPGQLLLALQLQLRHRAPIGEILTALGWAGPEEVQAALAEQHDLPQADFEADPPDGRLCRQASHRLWLKHRAIPWRRSGDAVQIATAHPDRFEALARALQDRWPAVRPVLAPEDRILKAIAAEFAPELVAAAAQRTPAEMSCRGWGRRQGRKRVAGLAVALVAATAAPALAFSLLCLLAVAALALFLSLRIAALAAHLTSQTHLTAPRPQGANRPPPGPLPVVSVLVPLYREREIAGALVRRLSGLTYPKALLDVILVLEEHDAVTRRALAAARLPPWMRVVEVPASGALTTKPRAMNYALDFCRGEIIGVWDAEDAPVPDQIETVVDRFARAPAEVVCLQGILDYYNPRTNWLSRCFTIEYAAWFRVLLPGIARLGLVVPLGGTTMFIRRAALETLGGWDAHNVTEDADLGVRLYRAGYRTELIDTVTYEEANFRLVPWIRQRSRWIKGFMVTYLVHMRRPRRLWSELGPVRFLGLQAFFVGTVGQFLLAPCLWSLWVLAPGWYHPLQDLLPRSALLALAGLLLLAEAVSAAIHVIAVAGRARGHLLPWVPGMMAYFPIGTLAAFKALLELATAPFYWDKTQHGLAVEEAGATGSDPSEPAARRH